MTEWEKTRERNEFEQASVLYQPLADMISDRFVSSSTLIGHKETSHDKEPEVKFLIDFWLPYVLTRAWISPCKRQWKRQKKSYLGRWQEQPKCGTHVHYFARDSMFLSHTLGKITI